MSGGEDEDVVAESAEHPLATEEWLVALVLGHVADAREVCRLASVNRNFRAASFSGLVWQRRLPPQPTLDAVVAPSQWTRLSQRDLYILLCKSVLYDDGLKRFWLDPASGGDCYMISARGLSIVWGDTPQYWKWKPWPGAMFQEVAYLETVCWFDIKGTFQQVLRPGKYVVSFRMQVKHREASGCWEGSPIKLRLENTTYAHPPCLSQVLFDGSTAFKRRRCPLPNSLAVSEIPSTSGSGLLVRRWSSESDEMQMGSSLGIHDMHQCRSARVPDTSSGNSHMEREQGEHSTFFKRLAASFMNSIGRALRLRSPELDHITHLSACSETTNGASDAYDSDGCEAWSQRGLEKGCYPSNRGSGACEWVECDVGEFVVEDENEGLPVEVQFSMQEIEVLWWKGGFTLDGVIIRPSIVAAKVEID